MRKPSTLNPFRYNKVKYLSPPEYWVTEERGFFLDDFSSVASPFSSSFRNLPEGEYLIRGNKESHSKEFWLHKGIWYLVADTNYDNGHSTAICSTYSLFPSLPQKDWELLSKPIVFRALSPLWKRYLGGYTLSESNRLASIELRKTLLF